MTKKKLPLILSRRSRISSALTKMEPNSGMQGNCKRLLNMPSGAVFKSRLDVQKPPVRPAD